MAFQKTVAILLKSTKHRVSFAVILGTPHPWVLKVRWKSARQTKHGVAMNSIAPVSTSSNIFGCLLYPLKYLISGKHMWNLNIWNIKEYELSSHEHCIFFFLGGGGEMTGQSASVLLGGGDCFINRELKVYTWIILNKNSYNSVWWVLYLGILLSKWRPCA